MYQDNQKKIMDKAFETFRNYIYLDSRELDGIHKGFLGYHLTISPSCTETIDNIVSDNSDGRMESLVSQVGGMVYGDYRYYHHDDNGSSRSWYKYVRLTKKQGQYDTNGHTQLYYVLIYTRFTIDTALRFLYILFAVNTPEMRITRIKQSFSTCISKWDTIRCGIPINSQPYVCERIMGEWMSTQHFNTKVIISGPSQIGKLSLGCLLKRILEFEHPDFKHKTFVELFEDVDLSSPGLDVYSHILEKSSKSSPVIITVRNVEKYYKKVFQDNKDLYLTSHTDNKSSFNNMLDAIVNREYVITIFTTKLTEEDLISLHTESQSFFRDGRADLFINMTRENAQVKKLST